MKKIIYYIVGAFLLIAGISLIYGLYTDYQGQQVISNLQGNIYYLQRNDNLAMELWTSKADLNGKPVLLASNKDATNSNIINYSVNGDEINYIAMKDGKWAKWSVTKGSDKPNFLGYFEDDKEQAKFEKAMIRATENSINTKGELISQKGNIILKTPNGETEELLHYYGIYDSKFSSGFTSPQWSPDGEYIYFYYSGYRSPFTFLATSLVKDLFGLEDHNSQVYIMKLGEKNYYKYIRGNSLLWEK